MTSKNLLLILTSLIGLSAFAASSSQRQILNSYRVNPASKKVMDQLADRFEVERRLDGGYQMIVPADRVNELMKLMNACKLAGFKRLKMHATIGKGA